MPATPSSAASRDRGDTIEGRSVNKSTHMNHQNIIARLQAASGPNRETDGLIWAEIDGRDVREADGMVLAKSRRPPHDECVVGYKKPPIERYTSSVDAALTLIPEGLFYLVGIGRVRSGEPLAAAQILRPVTLDQVAEAEADTLPVAICIAALKARAV